MLKTKLLPLFLLLSSGQARLYQEGEERPPNASNLRTATLHGDANGNPVDYSIHAQASEEHIPFNATTNEPLTVGTVQSKARKGNARSQHIRTGTPKNNNVAGLKKAEATAKEKAKEARRSHGRGVDPKEMIIDAERGAPQTNSRVRSGVKGVRGEINSRNKKGGTAKDTQDAATTASKGKSDGTNPAKGNGGAAKDDTGESTRDAGPASATSKGKSPAATKGDAKGSGASDGATSKDTSDGSSSGPAKDESSTSDGAAKGGVKGVTRDASGNGAAKGKSDGSTSKGEASTKAGVKGATRDAGTGTGDGPAVKGKPDESSSPAKADAKGASGDSEAAPDSGSKGKPDGPTTKGSGDTADGPAKNGVKGASRDAGAAPNGGIATKGKSDQSPAKGESAPDDPVKAAAKGDTDTTPNGEASTTKGKPDESTVKGESTSSVKNGVKGATRDADSTASKGKPDGSTAADDGPTAKGADTESADKPSGDVDRDSGARPAAKGGTPGKRGPGVKGATRAINLGADDKGKTSSSSTADKKGNDPEMSGPDGAPRTAGADNKGKSDASSPKDPRKEKEAASRKGNKLVGRSAAYPAEKTSWATKPKGTKNGTERR